MTTPAPTPTVWPRLAWGFQKYCRWYVPRHFHAIRYQVDDTAGDPFAVDGPVVCFMNHAGWWDLVVGFGIAPAFWPGRTAYSPIDSAALEAYPLFNKLGLFPVERSAAGLRDFLRTSKAILENAAAAYWITPQGRFADPRERPLKFEPGLGHLAKASPGLTLIPIAVEYLFWNETLPEGLIRVGRPVIVGGDGTPARGWGETDPELKITDRWTAYLENRLTAEMDALAADAMARDPSRFETLHAGKAGVGFIYDTFRRARAFFAKEKYVAGHDAATAANREAGA